MSPIAMSKFGVHAMVWVNGWSHEDAERAISAAATIGYDLIEIPLLDPERIDIAHTRGLLEAKGLNAGVSLGLTPACDVSSADPATVARGAALLHKALDATVRLGGNYLGGVIYSAMGKYNHPASDKGRANSIATIRELAAEAKNSGVTVGLEPVNRYESNLLNTGAQALRFIDEVGGDNVKVHLDTYHMNIEEADTGAAIELCGERLGYFHVNESHRGYLGTGNIAFWPMFRALARIGYDRPIAFEAFTAPVASEQFAGMLAIWRDLWSDSDDIAAHALSFMRGARVDGLRVVALGEAG